MNYMKDICVFGRKVESGVVTFLTTFFYPFGIILAGRNGSSGRRVPGQTDIVGSGH